MEAVNDDGAGVASDDEVSGGDVEDESEQYEGEDYEYLEDDDEEVISGSDSSGQQDSSDLSFEDDAGESSDESSILESDVMLPSVSISGRATGHATQSAAYPDNLSAHPAPEVATDGHKRCRSRGAVNYLMAPTQLHEEVDSLAWHFQTSDALVLIPSANFDQSEVPRRAADRQQYVDVVVGSTMMLKVFRLPADTAVAGGIGAMGQHTAAQLIASARLPVHHYSLAVSPCGRYVAAGGDQGFLHLYSYQPPAASPVSPGSLQRLAIFKCGNGMNNCVRFGRFGGMMRLIVTCQRDGGQSFLWLLNVPSHGAASGSATLAAGDAPGSYAERGAAARPALCRPTAAEWSTGALPPWIVAAGRGRGSVEGLQQCSMPNIMTQTIAMLDEVPGSNALVLAARFTTAAVGPFATPTNCAQPSPAAAAAMDSNQLRSMQSEWLAVACDEPLIYLVPSGVNYQSEAVGCVRLDQGPLLSSFECEERLSPGCQYCAWSGDGQLLAASSDALKAVYVVSTSTCSVVLVIRHDRPVLPVTFAPWDHRLLVWTNLRRHIYVCDLRHPEQSLQRVSLGVTANSVSPMHADPILRRPDGRVTGLAATAAGHVLVATDLGLLHLQLLKRWTPNSHHAFPPSFKAAARVLLLACAAHAPEPSDGAPAASSGAGASRAHGMGGALPGPGPAARSLQDLPQAVVEAILAHAALPLHVWAGVGHDAVLGLLPPGPTILTGPDLLLGDAGARQLAGW